MFKLIKQGEYNLLKRMSERQDNYIEQIRQLHKLVEKHEEDIKNIEFKISEKDVEIELKEHARRKIAGKVGGMQASLNNKDKKIDTLKELNNSIQQDLKDTEKELSKKNEELKETKQQLEFFKNHRRAPSLEDYKNYVGQRKELEKRSKKC